MEILTNTGLGGLSNMLVHGPYNSGKTYLIGSALAHEKEKGKCIYVLVGEEPSLGTLLQHDLEGVEIVRIDAVREVEQLAKDMGQVHMIGLDSLWALCELAEEKVTKGDHAPGGKVGVKDGRREWGELKFEFRRALGTLMKMSTFLFAVCPSVVKKETEDADAALARPMLVGQLGSEVFGRFGFVGYMEAVGLTASKTRRILDFSYRNDARTRWNAPSRPARAFVLEEGKVCWNAVRAELDEALEK